MFIPSSQDRNFPRHPRQIMLRCGPCGALLLSQSTIHDNAVVPLWLGNPHTFLRDANSIHSRVERRLYRCSACQSLSGLLQSLLFEIIDRELRRVILVVILPCICERTLHANDILAF
jgi:hypothetical protein